jgi:hypothetical protein
VTPPNPVDVLTQHNDQARTGVNAVETQLTPSSVESGAFQRLFDWRVDGQIYGQPLYVSGLNVGNRTVNMVLVTTMNNSVYAFEAPLADSYQEPSKNPLWKVDKKTLGSPLPYDFFPMSSGFLGHNIRPLIGIVATPVIDLKQGLVFVTAKSGHCAFLTFFCSAHYRLFALNLVTGGVQSNVEITASYLNSKGVVATFDATHQLQRAGLVLDDNSGQDTDHRLYLAFGSHQDSLPYHGWILEYAADKAAPLKLNHAYCTSCELPEDATCAAGSCEGGIWQAGGAPARDANGNLYVISGNGSTAPDARDLATSIIKLDRDLNLVGSWTPPNFDCLNRTDADLGSAGPLLLADKSVLVGGGKEGLLYAVPTGQFNGQRIGEGKPLPLGSSRTEPCAYVSSTGATAPAVWTIQATPLWDDSFFMDILRLIAEAGLAQGYHHIHGAPVAWKSHDDATGDHWFLYVSAERDLLRGFEFSDGFVKGSPHGTAPTDSAESRCPNSHRGMPGGFLSLSANGSIPSSAILWAAMPRRDEDALRHIVHGVLRAYRAYPDADGKLVEIWNSDDGAHPRSDADCQYLAETTSDELGLFAKYVPPTIAEGKVYMATFSHRLVVYGLKAPSAAPALAEAAAAFDAALTLPPSLPASVEPGSTLSISVTATNTSTTTPWLAADGIRLDSQSIPDFDQLVVGGANALLIQHDVAPQGIYTFTFKLRLPAEEGPYSYLWRMKRADASSQQPAGEWFGQSSSAWSFTALRSSCADIRNRAAGLSQQVASELAAAQAAGSLAVSMETTTQVQALERDAAKRRCSIPMNMIDMHHSGQ